MRHHVWYPLIALIFAACADNPPGAGTEGHPCRNWPAGSACDDGLTCQGDVCVACGAPDQRCCSVPGGSSTCDLGYACESAWGEEGVCQKDCGLPGLPCCPSDIGGYCPGGTTCDQVTDTCEGDPADPCTSGSLPYSVWIVDGSCQAIEVVFLVDSAEQAEACRQGLVDVALPTEEICALGQVPDDTEVCRHGMTLDEQLYLPNCGSAQLEVCMAAQCAAPECTWDTGSCP